MSISPFWRWFYTVVLLFSHCLGDLSLQKIRFFNFSALSAPPFPVFPLRVYSIYSLHSIVHFLLSGAYQSVRVRIGKSNKLFFFLNKYQQDRSNIKSTFSPSSFSRLQFLRYESSIQAQHWRKANFFKLLLRLYKFLNLNKLLSAKSKVSTSAHSHLERQPVDKVRRPRHCQKIHFFFK